MNKKARDSGNFSGDLHSLNEEKLQMLVSVAKAYYEQDATQQEIADALMISRPQISRYLLQARQLGIVNITVTAPDSHSEKLENKLRALFPALQNTVVVPLDAADENGEYTILGRAGAKFLMEHIQNGMLIGISAGKTVKSAIQWLKPTRSDIKIVQIMGNTGYFERRVDYNEQAHEAAAKLECPLFLINAPTVLWKTAGTVEQLMAENPALANSIRMSNTCDIYLLGVGSMGNDDIYVKSGMIEEEDIQAMMKDGAVGNLCSTFFRQDGSICNTDFEDRIVGVRIQEITKAQYSILMAAGSHKVNAIIGVLRGGFVNTLITDSSTAEAVIQMELE